MIGLILGGVVIAATTAAFLYDHATEAEKQRHVDLEREHERLREEFEYYLQEKDRDVSSRAHSYPQEWIKLLDKELKQLSKKISPIRKEISRIFPLILDEAKSPSTDSFRRNMLKREMLRFDDAKRKLEAYESYIAWYKDKLEQERRNPTGEVFQLSPPSATLPEFWLYPGKLIKLPLDMLSKKLPDFGHSVALHNFPHLKELQKVYFLQAGQESSPVLIENEHRNVPGVFFGCALKGRFFLEHVIEGEPAKFSISSTWNECYIGTMMEGAIRAILPTDKTYNAGLNRREGDILNVYPDEFDLLLRSNYTERFKGNSQPLPIVTEMPEYNLYSSKLDPLFLLLDSASHSKEACQGIDDTSIPFNLLEASINDKTNLLCIRLAKNGFVIECHVNSEGWLQVHDITRQSEAEAAEGIELPILIVPAETEMRKSLSPCPKGLALLDMFIERLNNVEKRQKSAAVAISFFEKWTEVLDFLKEEEGVLEIEIPVKTLRVTEDKEGFFQLDRTHATEESFLDTKDEIVLFWDSFQSELDNNPNNKVFLSVWDSNNHTGKWLKLFTTSIEVTNDYEAFKVVFKRQETFQNNRYLFKFSFRTKQYSPLERQKSALLAMRDDRFSNCELRDALILPSSLFYTPKNSPLWQKRLSESDLWSPKPNELSVNQKDVVKTCLSVEPLVLVQGPPGTGKTRCILEIVYQFLSQNPSSKILITSQQNTAVDNVIEQLEHTHAGFLDENSISIMRIGNEEKMSSTSQQYSFASHLNQIANTLTDSNKVSCSSLNDAQEIDSIRNRLGEYLLPQIEASRVDNEVLFCMTRGCQIVAATCVGLANKAAAMDQCQFDLVIIDEAGRSTPPELLIPLKLAKKAVIIGDHYQLPPSVNPLLREDKTSESLPFLRENFLENSYFGSLFEELPDTAKCQLTDQYRMDNAIGDLIAHLFYTTDGTRMLHNGIPAQKDNGIIQWVDVEGVHKRVGTSLYNEIEANKVYDLLNFIEKIAPENIHSIAIITPYREQKKLLLSKYSEDMFSSFKVAINTVDQFQGSEADIVIYSTVRTSGNIDFLLDQKRLNVACSRAKHMLFFVGNKSLFSKKEADNFFSQIIEKHLTSKSRS